MVISMEKSEAANRLKKAGYQVQFDASVVTVILPTKVNRNQEIKKLHGFFEEIGYHASFGVKQIKGSNVEEKEKVHEFEELRVQEFEIEEGKEEKSKHTESAFEYSKEKTEDVFEQVEIGEQFSLEDFGIS